MTMYRAGGDSPIARSLIRAAERGVQVAVLVELKARFDEATNVDVGQGAGARRRARGVRLRRVEDPRQVRARGARRRRRAAPLLPHRHRQLQLANGPALRGPRVPHVRPADRRRRRPAVQPPHRVQPGARLLLAARGAARHARPADRSHRARVDVRHRGAHHRQDELARRPRDGRGAVRGEQRRRAASTCSCAASAACVPACRA